MLRGLRPRDDFLAALERVEARLTALEATPLLFATLCVFVYYGVARAAAGTGVCASVCARAPESWVALHRGLLSATP